MQKFLITKGATSVILPISIFDSSSTTGAKLTGLVFNTAGLTAYYNRSGASGAATAITLATATKGTWATGGFVAIDGTNMPGDYELHIPNAAIASGANTVLVQLKGATNMVPVNLEIDLFAVDLQDSVRAALTALPNVASGSAGAIPTTGTGANQISVSSGLVTLAGVTHTGAVIPTVTTTTTATNLTNLPSIPANWLTAAGINASALNGKGDWNVGKTGYSLTQAFPTNFSAMSLTAGGLVTLAAVTHTGAVIPTVTTLTGHTAQTGDNYARLGAPAGASVSADVAAVKADTAAVKTKTDFLPSATAGAAGGVFIAGTNAATSVTTALTANITGNLSGSVGSVTGSVGSVTGAVGSVTGAVGSVSASGITRASFSTDSGLQTIISNTAQAGAATTITLDASASAVNDFYKNDIIILTGGTGVGQARFISAYTGSTKIATVTTWATNPDATTTFSILPFDAIAGASAPTTAQIATAVWTDLLASSDFTTASSVGKLLKDDVDATISSRMATYTQPTGFLSATFPSGTVANTTNITAGTITTATNLTTNNDKTGYGLSAAAVQAIWDALTSALTTVGSIGKKLADWVIGTSQTGDSFARLGAPAGASVSADIAAVKSDTAAVKTKTDFLPSATAGAAGGVFIAGSNAATSVTTALTANITGNLSGSVGSVTGAVGSVTGAVGSVTGNVGGNVVGSVASVTAGVTVTTNNDKTGYALTSGERTSVADALLDRDMATGTDNGSPTVRTVRQSLRFLRNKWTLTGTALSVKKEDDATESWSATVTTDAAAVPIVGSDPAG